MTTNKCVQGHTHHWLVEPPTATSSAGTCEHCGETREFLNEIPDDKAWRKSARRGSIRGAVTKKRRAARAIVLASRNLAPHYLTRSTVRPST